MPPWRRRRNEPSIRPERTLGATVTSPPSSAVNRAGDAQTPSRARCSDDGQALSHRRLHPDPTQLRSRCARFANQPIRRSRIARWRDARIRLASGHRPDARFADAGRRRAGAAAALASAQEQARTVSHAIARQQRRASSNCFTLVRRQRTGQDDPAWPHCPVDVGGARRRRRRRCFLAVRTGPRPSGVWTARAPLPLSAARREGREGSRPRTRCTRAPCRRARPRIMGRLVV